MSSLPSYFISHGGGPWPWMPDMANEYRQLRESLQGISRQLGQKPRAVLVVSAHWEADSYTVMSAQRPGMLYDYYGFPEHTYKVIYPSIGDPKLAKQLVEMICAAGLPAALDGQRGYDHGTFVPLQLMYPESDLPLLQLSIRSHYDVAEHLSLGRVLAPLRQQGVLIIGSGLSYHNLAKLNPSAREPSAEFDAWLDKVMALPGQQRSDELLSWELAPAARICHPREDHLVPLFVALGSAEDEVASRIYHQSDFFGAISVSSYRFGLA